MSSQTTQVVQEVVARNIAQRCGDYILKMKTDRLNSDTRLQAIRCIFDLAIAAAAGANESGPTATRATALQLFRDGNVPVWFTDVTSSDIGAAFANSAAAAVLDLDDGSRPARGHAGAAVIPVAISIGTAINATCEQILKAIVIGYEIAVTVGSARKRDDFGVSITWCTFGVVAAAAFLLELPGSQIQHALGIAGDLIPTRTPVETPRLEGSDTKEGIPWAVNTGINAVYLASNGHTGPRNVLDIFERYDYPENLRLGEDPHIVNTYFKLYTCCRYIHSPIDATLNLIERHTISVDRITSIDIHTIASAVRLENRTEPANLTDIAYSTQYCVALAILQGTEALLPLTNDALNRPEVSALAKKMNVLLDEDLDKQFPAKTLARVVIIADGKSYNSEVTAPKGEASDPLTWEQLEDKCRKATRLVAKPEQQDALIEAMVALRDTMNIKPLMKCFATMQVGTFGESA